MDVSLNIAFAKTLLDNCENIHGSLLALLLIKNSKLNTANFALLKNLFESLKAHSHRSEVIEFVLQHSEVQLYE